MSDNKRNGALRGKGYYIALIACAAAIGISGYVYYSNTGTETDLSDPGTPVVATDSVQATKPSSDKRPTATEPTQADIQPTQATQPTTGKLSTCVPVEGTTVAHYAMEVLSYNETTRDWRVHDGVDIAAEAGTTVCAAADGEVYTVYDDPQMGTTVVIRHEGGYTTKYSSLAETVTVSAGDTVRMGDPIGTVGTTALMETALGDHVHFSVTKNDADMDPADFLSMG